MTAPSVAPAAIILPRRVVEIPELCLRNRMPVGHHSGDRGIDVGSLHGEHVHLAGLIR